MSGKAVTTIRREIAGNFIGRTWKGIMEESLTPRLIALTQGV